MWVALRPHRLRPPDRRGFTIVELLIVIVVIGILAAITIVAFNGVTQRARVATVQSDLSNARKFMETYAVTNGNYPVDLPAAQTAGLKSSAGTTYQYSATNSGTSPTWCITATNSSTSYYLANTTQTTPTSGGCPGDGVGGVPAITNLFPWPGFETSDISSLQPASYSGATFTMSQATTSPYQGAAFGRATATSASTSYGGGLEIKLPTLRANTAQSVQLMLRSSRTIRVDAHIWTYASTTPGLNYLGSGSDQIIGQGVLTAGVWTKYSAVINPPSTVQSGIIIIAATSGAGQAYWAVNDTLDADAVMLTPGSTSFTYADGNSPRWIWNGAPDASTSTGPQL